MPFKLALRNVKRRVSTYSVYFVTVALTAALMLASNGVLFSRELSSYGGIIFGYAIPAIRSTSVIVAAVVCFIVCHTTSWLLDRRRREFGTYLLLGVPRGKLLSLFVAENSLVGLISFLAGSALGVGLFYVFNIMVCGLMGNGMSPLAFDPIYLFIALIEWIVIFAIAIAWSSRILKKAQISELVHGKRGLRRKYTPRVNAAMSVTGLVVVIGSFVVIFAVLSAAMFGGFGQETAAPVVVAFALAIFAGIFLVYYGLRGLPLRKIMKKLPKRGDGDAPSYEYRDAAYSAGALVSCRGMARSADRNAVITGLIAVIMTIAVMLTCFMTALRYILVESINTIDFDVRVMWRSGHEYDITPEELADEAKKYAEPETVIRYDVYETDESYCKAMSESDANKLLAYYGEPTVDVSPGSFVYLLHGVYSDVRPPVDENGELTVYGETLTFGSVAHISTDNVLDMSHYLVIDDALASSEEAMSRLENTYLLMNIDGTLPPEWHETAEKAGLEGDIYSIFEERGEIAAVMSSAIIASLFLGSTFTMMSMALLSLRVTADAGKDRRRYAILSVLGMCERDRRRMLRRDLFGFFALPLALPLLTTFPILGICAMLSEQVKGVVYGGMFAVGLAVPLVYVAIFACYLGITYYMSVRTVLRPERASVYLLSEGDGA